MTENFRTIVGKNSFYVKLVRVQYIKSWCKVQYDVLKYSINYANNLYNCIHNKYRKQAVV